jgi:hypothetical protein
VSSSKASSGRAVNAKLPKERHGHVLCAGGYYGRCAELLSAPKPDLVLVQLTPCGERLILKASEFQSGPAATILTDVASEQDKQEASP